MKNHIKALFLPSVACIALATGGCSWFHHHHEPKSSFKIIQQGDRNPSIIDEPDVEKNTPFQKVEVESGPVDLQ